MKSTTDRRARRSTARATALACLAGLAVAPGALAQTGVGPADTVIGSLNGGVQQPHKYICDPTRAEVKYQIEGVQDSLKSRYPSMSVMASRGYAPYLDAPIAIQQGQGHWLNPNMINDGHIMDPAYPEGILVDVWGRPIGVMYIEDAPETPGPDMYMDDTTGVACNAWHYHTEIAADTYWDLYKYGWSPALSEGDYEPEPRSPDLMHVWAYGPYSDQWDHNKPKSGMPGQPTAEEQLALIGGPKPPMLGQTVPPPARLAIKSMRAKYLASSLKGVRAHKAARKAAARRAARR